MELFVTIHYMFSLKSIYLRAHNWQNENNNDDDDDDDKCPCHKMYRVKAVGLSFSNNLYFYYNVACEIWASFVRN